MQNYFVRHRIMQFPVHSKNKQNYNISKAKERHNRVYSEPFDKSNRKLEEELLGLVSEQNKNLNKLYGNSIQNLVVDIINANLLLKKAIHLIG